MTKRAKGTSDENKHVGYGKLILFGEHFVVYKLPALVGAVKAFTSAQVELCPADEWSTGLTVVDKRPAIPGYKDKKAGEMLESTRLVFKHLGVDLNKRGAKVTLAGDLAPVSGIGASAANCVSVARALAEQLGQDLNQEEINRAGYEGEKAYHGTPSGIDNTASTYGGVLKFQRTDGDPIFETRNLKKEVLIVYASTGITSSTTEVVGDVRKKKEADPAWFDALQERYMSVYNRAEKAIAEKADDLPQALAELCDECHVVMSELGVSCKELDDLVTCAKEAGALGAKMSGTGRGGLMFAICDSPESQKKVYDALSKKAPQLWMTSFL